MNPESITPTSFRVDKGGVPVLGTIQFYSRTGTFYPSANLDPDTRYTVTITTVAKNTLGDLLEQPYVFTFTTGPAEEATTYTVTYDGNGKTGGTVPTDANTYLSGGSVTVLTNSGTLVKTGFTFLGWNTKDDGTGTDYATGSTYTMGSANVILYAKWTAAAAPRVLPVTGDMFYLTLTFDSDMNAATVIDANIDYSGIGIGGIDVAYGGSGARQVVFWFSGSPGYFILKPAVTSLGGTPISTSANTIRWDGSQWTIEAESN